MVPHQDELTLNFREVPQAEINSTSRVSDIHIYATMKHK